MTEADPHTPDPQTQDPQTLGRVARRRQRSFEALIQAGQAVMGEKGIDAATMAEIAALADIGAGTVYSFFKSKDDLALAVLERLMFDLGNRIERVTNTFSDPAQVYAFGVRNVLETATHDLRWKQLLNRSEVMADAMFRQMGPFAVRDMENASRAGRFRVDDATVVWRMATHAIVGVALAITTGVLPEAAQSECLISLLCMTGIGRAEAVELAARPCPALPAN